MTVRSPDNELRFVIFHWSLVICHYLPNLSPRTSRLCGEAFWLRLGCTLRIRRRNRVALLIAPGERVPLPAEGDGWYLYAQDGRRGRLVVRVGACLFPECSGAVVG